MAEALLIVDMSNDFVHDQGNLTAGTPAQNIVPKITQLADEFLNNDNLVVFCMDAHEENDPHFELWPPHNIKGTWGQEIYGELGEWYQTHKEDARVYYVPKPEYDAFFDTELDDILKSNDVDTVHITGVCTDICDFLTAYGAYARGYHTVAHQAATATFTDQHELFLEHMKAVFKTDIR
ncbi:cysteine hydrolase family protein [Camelliibacillus cellulosilyticus]|uniref:Cysteine hydrolase family protein n=1 Tax=Camelliibacillus cellulosilyticus TaxID=2174486 RepID=A0ABV9GHV7_9BACL